jgi:hypothetical protein
MSNGDPYSKIPLKPNQLSHQSIKDIMNNQILPSPAAGVISEMAGGRSNTNGQS